MKIESSDIFSRSIRPWGLLSAAGYVACLSTLLGFLGRYGWFLDLFSHFRVQYIFGLGILGILLLLARRFITATVFVFFCCINVGVVLPLYLGDQATVPEGAHTLRAMLLNVNTQRGDADQVRDVIQDADPDILVLEEISSQWILDLAWLTNSHPYVSISPREDNFGIGLFSKLPLIKDEIVRIGDAAIPSILATVDTGKGHLRIIATHACPPANAAYSRWRNDQLERLPDHVGSSLPVVLLGDLNTTPWNYYFKRLLSRSGLIDSAKGRGIQPTWPSQNPLLLIPIDHCLHSPDVVVVNRSIGADVNSDHYPLIVDFIIIPSHDKNAPTNRQSSKKKSH